MNSIVKINENLVVDLVLVKAISYIEDSIYVHFINDEHPLAMLCTYEDYLNFYTKWRNHAQWRIDLILGESE